MPEDDRFRTFVRNALAAQRAVDQLAARPHAVRPQQRADLEAIAKNFPPHVRAEWNRQQRILRAAVAYVRFEDVGASDDARRMDDLFTELCAAVEAFR